MTWVTSYLLQFDYITYIRFHKRTHPEACVSSNKLSFVNISVSVELGQHVIVHGIGTVVFMVREVAFFFVYP